MGEPAFSQLYLLKALRALGDQNPLTQETGLAPGRGNQGMTRTLFRSQENAHRQQSGKT